MRFRYRRSRPWSSRSSLPHHGVRRFRAPYDRATAVAGGPHARADAGGDRRPAADRGVRLERQLLGSISVPLRRRSPRSPRSRPRSGRTSTRGPRLRGDGDRVGRPRRTRRRLVARSRVCGHVTMVSGRCPDGGARSRSARPTSTTRSRGTTLRIAGVGSGRGTSAPTHRLTVTGVYRQERGAYWLGQVLTGRSGVVSLVPPNIVQHDVVTDRSTFEGGTGTLPQESSLRRHGHRPDAVGVDELLELGTAVRRLSRRRG